MSAEDDETAEIVALRPHQDMQDDERMLAIVPRSEQPAFCGHFRNSYSLDERAERAYCRECKAEVPLFDVLQALARETERFIGQRKESQRRARVAEEHLAATERLERNAKARARKALAKIETCECGEHWSGWGSAYWKLCPMCGGTRPKPDAERRERERAKVLDLVQSQGCAESLDEITKRLASRLDASDTDEGMERMQTWLNARIVDALTVAIRP